MLRRISTRRRLILCFALQTLLAVGGLLYMHRIAESQIHVLGRLTRDVLEHSVNIESALFRIQAVPAEQTLELIQASILLYSDPGALERAVKKVSEGREELQNSLESVKISIRRETVMEAVQLAEDSARRFYEGIDKAADLLQKGQKTEGLDVLMNRCTQLETALVASVSKLEFVCTGEQSKKLEEIRGLEEVRISSERRVIMGLILGSLIAGFCFILSIRRPLHPHAG
jgi:hypothetical protein